MSVTEVILLSSTSFLKVIIAKSRTKVGLIAGSFSLWLQSPKKVPNHAFEPFSLGEKCSGRDLAPLEIEANMKNFLRLSHLILSMIVIFPLSIPSRIVLIVLDLDEFFMKI